MIKKILTFLGQGGQITSPWSDSFGTAFRVTLGQYNTQFVVGQRTDLDSQDVAFHLERAIDTVVKAYTGQ